MKKRFKAALLSALVYPGVGHFHLKKYKLSVTILAAFTLPLVMLFIEVATKAEQIMSRVNRGEIPLDIDNISNQLTNAMIYNQNGGLNTYVWLLILIWLFAMLDAYRQENRSKAS